MKQLQVQVPANQVEVIQDLVEKYQIHSTEIKTTGNESLFILKIHDAQSNNLLHELKARGVGDVFGEISVLPVNVFISHKTLKSEIPTSAAANLEEILADIEESAVLSITYFALVVLSGALAAFGLISDSTVIIIGSMIVAPLLGPVALTSIGLLLPRRGILRKGLTAELVGILATVAVGWIIGIILQPEETPQMVERGIEADPLNVAFAVVSGIAAGVIISRGQGMSIVGVAIAASLAPPAANIGLYLALGNNAAAQISAALLFVNILAINASCSIIFSLYRLPSKAGISKRRVTKTQRVNTVFTIIIIIGFIALSAFLLTQIPNA